MRRRIASLDASSSTPREAADARVAAERPRRRHHLLDDLGEAALDEVDAVAVLDVRGAGVGEPVPEVVVGEQAGDAGGEVGRRRRR